MHVCIYVFAHARVYFMYVVYMSLGTYMCVFHVFSTYTFVYLRKKEKAEKRETIKTTSDKDSSFTASDSCLPSDGDLYSIIDDSLTTSVCVRCEFEQIDPIDSK